jgi:hypothetical protein
MNETAVCPACAHEQCEDCIGPGCYCDCQMDTEDFYDDNEDETMKDGYA